MEPRSPGRRTQPAGPVELEELMGDPDCFVCRKHRDEMVAPGTTIDEDELLYAGHIALLSGQATAYLGYLMVEPKRRAATPPQWRPSFHRHLVCLFHFFARLQLLLSSDSRVSRQQGLAARCEHGPRGHESQPASIERGQAPLHKRRQIWLALEAAKESAIVHHGQRIQFGRCHLLRCGQRRHD